MSGECAAGLPALIFTTDLLQSSGPLNGRRWAAQELLRIWARDAADEPLHFLAAGASLPDELHQAVRTSGHSGPVCGVSLLDPHALRDVGALFLPDPSIGRWASWRQAAGANSFSLIGQIHTLSTPAALGMLDALVYQEVQPWDALICSSSAGKQVVETLLQDRREQLARRLGAMRFPSPQLPVIPLPLPDRAFSGAVGIEEQAQARRELGIPADTAVVLWLGRLSILTKADPWPTYSVLDRVAQQLNRPLLLLECGPDDTPEQGAHFAALRQHCTNVQFKRLGGEAPVPESTKLAALAAADVALSLVDNPQETFGLSVAEAMAAGLPVVASNWDGYRDLVEHAVHGLLVPSRWSPAAEGCSFALGWQQELQLQSYPMVAGALAQLVQLDLESAEGHLLTLLNNPAMAKAMGRAGRRRAQERFAAAAVMKRYRVLFEDLQELRNSANTHEQTAAAQPPKRLDPAAAFAGFASNQPREAWQTSHQPRSAELQNTLLAGRAPLWELIKTSMSHVEKGAVEAAYREKTASA